MNWFWIHRGDHQPRPSEEARDALERNQRSLVSAKAMRAEATIVGDAAAKALAHNHFGEAVTAAMRGKP